MRKLPLLLVTASAMAFSTVAYAADEKYESKVSVDKKDNGDYKATTKTSHTDTAGTKTTSDSKVKIDVDKDGTIDKTTKTEETTDPKGLMNKTKTKIKDEEKTHTDGTVETSHKKTVDGKTVEDTSTNTK